KAFKTIAGRSWRCHAACCGEHDNRPGRTRTASAELAVSVDENRSTAALVDSVYAGDEGGRLRSKACVASNADSVGLTSNTLVAHINIVVACSDIDTGDVP